MLSIKNLQISVDDKPIIHCVDLDIGPGEVHAIMGPNGSGKSTLAHLLAGHEGYLVTGGTVLFDGSDLLALETEERAHAGIFLGMQYPVELPGVNNMNFMRASLNAQRRARGEDELDAIGFMQQVRAKAKQVGLNPKLLERSVNSGFSGGEKKRNEILQMSLLEPKLVILDETDSGLDIDAMRVIADAVNGLRDSQRSLIVVTHYQRLLNYIQPDYVHVLINGRIVLSGRKELAQELEHKGYGWLEEKAA